MKPLNQTKENIGLYALDQMTAKSHIELVILLDVISTGTVHVKSTEQDM